MKRESERDLGFTRFLLAHDSSLQLGHFVEDNNSKKERPEYLV